MTLKDFPKFKGRVVTPDNAEAYDKARYQYAVSSHKDIDPEVVKPAAIIYAFNDDDVKKAISYASTHGIAVAVRTGGHQYSAASTTGSQNIQLDLSNTYMNFQWENDDCTVVTLGVSGALADFNWRLGRKGRFLPHGQCKFVNLGGHIQTGGFGQLTRGFGLLADHVQKFRIITADGKPQWVRRGDLADKELFFAVLGGSPGNFGVLTDVTFDVLRDEDHPNSRGFRAFTVLNSEVLKNLLDQMVEDMVKDDDLPGDFDYSITVLTETQDAINAMDSGKTYDERYVSLGDTLYQPTLTPGIILFLNWGNLGGAGQDYDPTIVKKIKKLLPEGYSQVIIDDDKHIPMSELSAHWMVPIEREYDLPYVKRCYTSNSTAAELKSMKWSGPVSTSFGWLKYCCTSAQYQYFGGKNSTFTKNGGSSQLTSHSWRDTRLACTMDAFYFEDPLGEAREEAEQFSRGVDIMVGWRKARFCQQDRRFIWGSFDLDLSNNRERYFDNTPYNKYQKLVASKKKYDPNGVFTPNRFCIGLAPKDGQAAAPPSEAELERQADGIFAGWEKAAKEWDRKHEGTTVEDTLPKDPKKVAFWKLWKA